MKIGGLKKVLPTLLVCVSTAGVVGTGYFAAKGRERHLHNKKELSNPANAKELLKREIMPYIPATICGVASIGCMWTAHILDARQIAALTATCGYLVAYKDKIEKKIEEKFGEDTLKEIKHEVMVELEHEPWGKISIPSAEETGNGDLLVIEGYSGRVFRSSEEAVRAGVREFQSMLVRGEAACLNDLYQCLGIQGTHFGFQYGYPGGDDFKEFFHEEPPRIDIERINDPKDLNEPVLCIDIYDYPMECWQEY